MYNLLLVVLTALGTVLAPVSTASAQGRQGDVAWHYQRAQEALQREDIGAAAREFKAVVGLRPDLPQARSNLGLMYHMQRKYEAAIEQFQEALRLDSNLASASMFLGIDYYLVSRPGLAIAKLEQALSLDPRSAPARKWLAMSYLLVGNPQRAVFELKKAQHLSPNDHELTFHLGRAYLKLSQLAFHTLRSVGSETPWFFLVRGRQFEHQNKPMEALEEYRHAARADVNFPGVHHHVGRLLEANHQFSEAAEAYLRELRSYRGHARASVALAAVLDRLGFKEEAKEVTLLARRRHGDILTALESARTKYSGTAAKTPMGKEKSLDKNTIHEFIREERELVAKKSRKPLSCTEEARDAILGANPMVALRLLEVISCRPVARKAKYWKGRALLDLGQFDDALETFVTLEGSDPDNPELAYYIQRCTEELAFLTLELFGGAEPNSYRTHQLQAEYYAAQGKNERAIVQYRRALDIHPGAPLIHLAIGELHVIRKDHDSALVSFEAELRSDPYSVAALTGAGQVCVTKGQLGRAEELLRKAVSINPNSVVAQKELGKTYYTQGDYSRAAKHLQLALDSGADEDETVYYQLARALLKLGDRAQAQKNLAMLKELQSAKRQRIQERVESSYQERLPNPSRLQ